MIFLKNDYSIGAHPDVLKVLNETNSTYFDSYGNDEAGVVLKEKIRRLTDCPDAAVHGIVGGTLTNKTCLSAFTRPYEAVVTTCEGHIAVHETGAVEATGHRLIECPTQDGKILPGQVSQVVKVHNMDQMVIPKVLYISDTTEMGAVYTKSELAALRKVCDENDMYLYIDGARLAMALGARNNDMTMADIAHFADAFYIGGNKCGAMFGELVVITNDELKENFRFMMRQNGALLSKGWLIWLQFEALLKDGLYEKLGRHCDEMGMKLAQAIKAKGYKMAYEPESNMIFPVFPTEKAQQLAGKVMFENWEDRGDEQVIRLVTSWATKEEEIDGFLELI